MLSYGLLLNQGNETLDEAMRRKGMEKLENVKLVVSRSNYKLTVYSGDKKVIAYRAVFGRNRSKRKISADDFATPSGNYRICNIDTSARFYRTLQLNYPNRDDAADALRDNIISKTDYLKLFSADSLGECIPKHTPLGANIGIQGSGKFDFVFRNLPFVFNWTNGSIAVSNKNIDEIISVVKIGTPVEIIL